MSEEVNSEQKQTPSPGNFIRAELNRRGWGQDDLACILDRPTLLDDYLAEHGNAPADPSDVFRWARMNRRWEPPSRNMLKQFKDELQRAAREDFFTDPQGRTVRRKHAIVVKDGEMQHS